MLKAHVNEHRTGATRGILEEIGKTGVGRRGWVKRFRVIVRPRGWLGAANLQFGAEKRTLRQTETVTLPPHPLGGVGGSQKSAGKKNPPDQTKDGVVQRRCHSVQMHTNEDSSPYPRLLITHKKTELTSPLIYFWQNGVTPRERVSTQYM